jgi:hypothetical protein
MILFMASLKLWCLSARTEGPRQPYLRSQPSRFTAWRLFVSLEIPNMIALPIFEIACLLVRLDHVTGSQAFNEPVSMAQGRASP